MKNTELFFNHIFDNARANAILIMNGDGIIQKVNAAFTNAYGYTTEDLAGKHFRLLFIEKDQLTRRPEIELNNTHRDGASNDENYLVHQNGTPIWVAGESVLVNEGESSCIVKITHNIHAQKQLERYLLSTSELLESLFQSVQQSGLLIVDSGLKVYKMNDAFRQMFGIAENITEGARLQQLNHPFWSGEELKNDLRAVLVNGQQLSKEYDLNLNEGGAGRVHITSKTLPGEDGSEKRILLMAKEA